VPYRGLADVVPEIRDATRGKVVISAVAPLEFVEGRLSPIAVPAGSAAQEIQDTLPEARVVSAFQTIDAHRLQDLDADLDTDIVVCSDDMQARRHVIAMTRGLPGVRAFSGGRLVGSRYVEELTALLITINRIYKVHSGMRLTGIEQR
jgi:NADPH-dependent F420 reductase